MKHISLRLPEELVTKASGRTLRSYVARNSPVPVHETEITKSDVIRLALSVGMEILGRRAAAEQLAQ